MLVELLPYVLWPITLRKSLHLRGFTNMPLFGRVHECKEYEY